MSKAQTLSQKIQVTLAPTHFELINDSHNHSKNPTGETHFQATIISSQFEGLKPIARHRLVMDLAKDEMADGLHALSISAWTPTEWEAREQKTIPLPQCHTKHQKE